MILCFCIGTVVLHNDILVQDGCAQDDDGHVSDGVDDTNVDTEEREDTTLHATDASQDDDQSSSSSGESSRELSAEDGETHQGTSATALIAVTASLGTQSVITGRIPMTVTVIPAIDSSKAQITWDIPRGLTVVGDRESWFRMENGVAETFTIEVQPERSGRYKVVIDVTAWRYDTNYVSSDTIIFEIDDALRVYPEQDGYTRARMIYRVTIFCAIIAGIVAGAVVVRLSVKRFKQWMAED